MLGFVKDFFGPKANPIGIDFGTDCLRMAQVRTDAYGQLQLVAAASTDVPSHVRNDPSARTQFFVEATRDMLAHGKFVGRQVILSLPAATMFIQHLRVPKMDDAALQKALPWEARGKIPVDPSQAVLRHLVAGEVFVEQEPKLEVIVLAATKDVVAQVLGGAHKAKLDVVGMNVEMSAVVDCFNHVYRRKTDGDATNCFVDIGASASRAIIARGGTVLFARSIPVGGEHFTRAVAEAFQIPAHEARLLRNKLAAMAPPAKPAAPAAPAPAPTPSPAEDDNNSFALLGAGLAASKPSADAPPALPLHERRQDLRDDAGAPTPPPEPEPRFADALPDSAGDLAAKARKAEDACRDSLRRLTDELTLCRRYYEATFPSRPVDRLIFIGGEAKQRTLCQQIARGLGLPAQVGDPLVRLGKTCDVPPELGLDRKQPQPGWAVAIGLSAGKFNAASATGDAKASA